MSIERISEPPRVETESSITVEGDDPTTKKWQNLSPIPNALEKKESSYAVGLYGLLYNNLGSEERKLYVRMVSNKIEDIRERYDPPVSSDEWRDSAACTEVPDLMDISNRNQILITQLARRVCGFCAVRQECLDDALNEVKTTGKEAENAQHGVRGGLSVDERRAMLRRSYRQSQPSK